MPTLELTAATTALVLIDLQGAIVARELAPHTASDVLSRSASLAARCRAAGATVVYVRVDLNNFRRLPVDQSMSGPQGAPPPASASEIVPEAGKQEGDLLITKRFWGAFIGTELEAELRKRGIETVVLGGIATNYGVESTAREGAALGFHMVVVEDISSSLSADMHRFPFEFVFPRLGRVRSVADVVAALG
jgi:nicotinamidase-related amidase